MKELPKVKKNLKTFLKCEDGKISKKSIITLSLLAASAAGIVINAEDVSADGTTCSTHWSFKYEDDKDYAQHSQHTSHTSY